MHSICTLHFKNLLMQITCPSIEPINLKIETGLDFGIGVFWIYTLLLSIWLFLLSTYLVILKTRLFIYLFLQNSGDNNIMNKKNSKLWFKRLLFPTQICRKFVLESLWCKSPSSLLIVYLLPTACRQGITLFMVVD